MLSALSVAELWRKEAARLAARSRLRASCRCRSTESRERSFTGTPRPREGFFGIGGGTFFSSCREKGRRLSLEAGVPRSPAHVPCRPGTDTARSPPAVEPREAAPDAGPEAPGCLRQGQKPSGRPLVSPPGVAVGDYSPQNARSSQDGGKWAKSPQSGGMQLP